MTENPGRRAVEAVWRIESARIVGALARLTGDLPTAEDLAQEALAEALVTWPRDGVPRQPAVRGEILTRLGRHDDARAALETALQRCTSGPERVLLERKLAALG